MHRWKVTIYDVRDEYVGTVASTTIMCSREQMNEILEGIRDAMPDGMAIAFVQC